jgi:hypothetical protein
MWEMFEHERHRATYITRERKEETRMGTDDVLQFNKSLFLSFAVTVRRLMVKALRRIDAVTRTLGANSIRIRFHLVSTVPHPHSPSLSCTVTNLTHQISHPRVPRVHFLTIATS